MRAREDEADLHGVGKPYDSGFHDTGDGHRLYFERYGSRGGRPAVFLHGGPGSGCHEGQRRLFDHGLWDVLFFDQRGAGKSLPRLSLDNNTTGHLVADMEALRRRFGIARWLVVGGSFGATLALAYAESHPQRVSALALRGVFLGSDEEVRWAFEGAARRFRPELWRAFASLLPEGERADVLSAWGRRILSSDADRAKAASWVWHDYERALSSLSASARLPSSLEEAGGRRGMPATPVMEWAYMRRGFFLEEGRLLAEAGRLRDIAGIVVASRYDLLCPPRAAFALREAWGERCELRFVEGVGHSLEEPGVASAVARAVAELAS